MSVENGSGIAVRNRDEPTGEGTGTSLDVVSNVHCGIVELFVCIHSVCDAFCAFWFEKFIAVLAIGIGVDASSRIVGLDPEHELERANCDLLLSEEETIRRIGTAVRVE